MPSYAATLRFLYSLHARGMKFGLATTRQLLARLGHPERRFPSVHIAGTNGKGSTSAFLASMFMEGGLRTGLYTSPHLVRFTERIRVNGREIGAEEVVSVTDFLRPLIEDLGATFFEVTTAIAFRHFAEQHVDAAVVETGLGGRLDSTNVLSPRVCVITTIGLDHTEILGRTPAAIAREKGGIMKRGVPCLTGDLAPPPLATLRSVARRRGAPLVSVPGTVTVATSGAGLLLRTRLGGTPVTIGPVHPGFAGPHQHRNAAAAVAAWALFRTASTGWKTPAAGARGLRRVVRNCGLRGRCETLRRDRRYILDVAHNPEGMEAFAAALRHRRIRNAVVVFGVMKDKDLPGMLSALAPFCGTLLAVRPRTPRARAAGVIVRAASRTGIPAETAGGLPEGLRRARRLAGRGGTVVVTGSHYVVGEALSLLDKETAPAYIPVPRGSHRHF